MARLLRFLVPLSVAVLSVACTHVRRLTVQPDAVVGWAQEVNGALQGRRAVVLLRDATRVDARDVRFDGENVSWIDQRSDERQVTPLGRVREVSFVSRTRGALDGAVIGAAVGAPAGMLLTDRSGPGAGDRAQAAAAGAVGVTIWTVPIGALKGSRIVYRFE